MIRLKHPVHTQTLDKSHYALNPDKPKESKNPGSDDVCIPDNVPHNYGSHSATNKSEDKKSFFADWF